MIDQLASQKKFTLVADGHTFNYLESDGYVFLCVADQAFGRQAPFACLDKIASDFSSSHGAAARDAIAHSLNRSFAPVLRQHMEYVSHNSGEVDKVSKVQQQVSEVKEIMMDNIEKVLDRGEKIELLVDKTENLRFQADNFHKTGRALRRRMWWQNLKMKLVFASFVVIVILILFLSFCYSNGNDCTKKKEN
jgi:vesicle-associated membrane protein 72